MKVEINEQISRFLDDELDHHELDDFLLSLNKQPELRVTLDRFQAVSQTLRTDQFVKPKDDFLSHIKQQIEEEVVHFLPNKTPKKKTFSAWQKTSFAMAASIACISLIVTQQNLLGNTSNQQRGAVVISQLETPENSSIISAKLVENEVVVANIEQAEALQHERFKAYLRFHSDDLYTHGSIG